MPTSKSCLTLAAGTIATTLAAAAAGCGSTAHHDTARASGCRTGSIAALHTSANAAVTTRPTAPQYGLTGCVYRVGPHAKVKLTIDRNPQGEFRFERAVVETDQNSIWSTTPALAPRLINGVGQGADWVPAYRQLLATDGVALFIAVVTGTPAANAQTLAITAMKGTLRARSGS